MGILNFKFWVGQHGQPCAHARPCAAWRHAAACSLHPTCLPACVHSKSVAYDTQGLPPELMNCLKPAAPLRTVHKDSKSGKVFFYDKEKELAQWNDPRKPTVIVQGERVQ